MAASGSSSWLSLLSSFTTSLSELNSLGSNRSPLILSDSRSRDSHILSDEKISKYAVYSLLVKAFSSPPFFFTVWEKLFGPYFLLPLNIICSRRWLIPVFPGLSFLEPTLYHIWKVATGALCSSRRSPLRPLSKACSFTPSHPAAKAETETKNKIKKAEIVFFMLPPMIKDYIQKLEGCQIMKLWRFSVSSKTFSPMPLCIFFAQP